MMLNKWINNQSLFNYFVRLDFPENMLYGTIYRCCKLQLNTLKDDFICFYSQS